MSKRILTVTLLSLFIGSPGLAQDNQHFAEIIADCSMLGLAERNAPFSDPIPLSELQETPFYFQMVNGMVEALDSLDAASDKEGAADLIEKMLSGMPDGDIPLDCFRTVRELKELSQ
jgi:hypothetical protein